MEIMARYEDNHFDLAIVDPPYGIGDFRSTKSKNRHKKIDWNEEIPTQQYFNELIRVSKNRIIFGINYYAKYVDDVGRIVHDKTGGGKRQNPKEMSNCDIASHSFGVNMRIFHYVSIGNVIGNVIDWENEMRWHPCQKPIALYEWLLMNYAKEGDKILDTHLGSGSIAIACHNLGFDLTACELDKEYFNAAMKRLKQHQAQLTMF
jgi:site-specific DNA-methyltransferase (adenine-specific)